MRIADCGLQNSTGLIVAALVPTAPINEDESTWVRQILDAGDYLDGADFSRIERCAFSGAYLAISRAFLALAGPADFDSDTGSHPIGNSKTGTSHRIRDPGDLTLARATCRKRLDCQDGHSICGELA